jgi:hypothetical protein
MTDSGMLALFCSRACPGNLILRAYDLAVALRDARVPVIGGFQTPVERELLDVLLRGGGLVTIVEARGERARMPAAWRAAVRAGRLTVEAPFAGVRRPTVETAMARNRMVIERAGAVLVVHAQAGGATEALAREVVAAGKRLLTLESGDGANANLLALGSVAVVAGDADRLAAMLAGIGLLETQ